jgi:tight adherence protein B
MIDWLIYVLVFSSTVLLVLGLNRYFARDRSLKKKINRRLTLLDNNPDHEEILNILRQERGISSGEGLNKYVKLQELLVQSGLRIGKATFGIALAGLTTSIVLIASIIFGFKLIDVPASVLSSCLIIYMFIRTARAKRIKRFSQQLPEILDIVVRSLRVGHPLPISLAMVAKELPDPAGTEFGIAADEVTYGLDLPTAVMNLAERVGDPDLLFLVTAVSIQNKSGGNLGEILTNLAKLLRERFRMERKIRSLTSEGRGSAIMLTAIPIVLFLYIRVITPNFYGDVWTDPTFRKAMMIAVGMLIVGNYWLRQMVNFKY